MTDDNQPRQTTTAAGGSRLSTWGKRRTPQFSLVVAESTSPEALEDMLARAARQWAGLSDRFAAAAAEADEPGSGDEDIDWGSDGSK